MKKSITQFQLQSKCSAKIDVCYPHMNWVYVLGLLPQITGNKAHNTHDTFKGHCKYEYRNKKQKLKILFSLYAPFNLKSTS